MVQKKITEHFWWSETKVSESYPSLAKEMILSEEQKDNCFLLASLALEPIRVRFGLTKITSWVRDENLNSSVGGSRTSQHLTGEACDFICEESNMKEVFDWISKELKWPGQVFFYPKRGHIHIGLPRRDLRSAHKYM